MPPLFWLPGVEVTGAKEGVFAGALKLLPLIEVAGCVITGGVLIADQLYSDVGGTVGCGPVCDADIASESVAVDMLRRLPAVGGVELVLENQPLGEWCNRFGFSA